MKISDLTEKLEDIGFQLECIKDESNDSKAVILKSDFTIAKVKILFVIIWAHLASAQWI